MLRALTVRPEDQSTAAIAVMARADADVLVLGDVDRDHGLAGFQALQTSLQNAGLDYDFVSFPMGVGGLDSGFDLDGDGRLREPEDSLGYGRFTGDNGVVVLSRTPLGEVRDHHDIMWETRRDLTGLVPYGVRHHVPLASAAMYEIEVAGLTLVVFANSSPVFDGPEDRNGLRNADQLAFLAERAGSVPLPVLIGRANLDPVDGDGQREAMRGLLTHPALQDPEPASAGGAMATNLETHHGNPALDTANWQRGPGPLRVDYILPARGIEVIGSGVLWPEPADPFAETVDASGPNRLIWVDLRLDGKVERVE